MTRADLRTRKEDVTLQTASTRYVDGDGIRFAYRRVGPENGIPLVLLQHFSGNIDAWDPAVVNGLANERPVIVFDNAGVGRSTGQTPDNVEAMARDAITFITSLGLTQVDLLGFSLGGCVAQQIASVQSGLVRKLILVGTAPRGGEQHLMAVLQAAFSDAGAPDPRLPLFFTSSVNSKSAGLAFLKRTKERIEDRDIESGPAVTGPQARALISWCAALDPEHISLRSISHPTLVVGGGADAMLPANNAYTMFKAMMNAQLVLYPDSGHGAIFQYPEIFVSNALSFLKV
ncbi:alpha/beta fold hydrolase [Paraburkholderia solisilvae]|nr:alpha/beta hydrolase [Paraburkholderia solisilvae]